MARTEVVAPSAVAAYVLKGSSSWWDQIDESPLWQNRIFHVLAVLYGIVAAVAVVQLVRIQLRVPEYVRSIVFIFRRDVQKLQPEILQHILLDMPSLAFFTTYALLVLFWAEIYYQARAVSTDGLRPSFYTINAVVYVVQCKFNCVVADHMVEADPTFDHSIQDVFCRCFFVCSTRVSSLWRKRLFLMLQRFPVESKGRRKKLQEVGYVTTICFSCFLVRCIMMCFNAFDKAADLDVLNHPVLNFIYYLFGGDTAFFSGPFHFEEASPKAWDHTISPYSLTGSVVICTIQTNL
ncbi:unnamed protein product [Camellia sinensis]